MTIYSLNEGRTEECNVIGFRLRC